MATNVQVHTTPPAARLGPRGTRLLLALMLPVLSAGCGSSQETQPPSSPAPMLPALAPGKPHGLDVFMVDASIVGDVDRVLDIAAYPPGTLASDEALPDDPCSAASPLTEIDPELPATLSFTLYPLVEGSRAEAGHYQVEIPLGSPPTRRRGPCASTWSSPRGIRPACRRGPR